MVKARRTEIRSAKAIDNENATKTKATRGNVYTIQTTQIHQTRKPTTTSMTRKRNREVCESNEHYTNDMIRAKE